MAAISGVVSSSSREVPYAPASVSGSDVGTARAYNNASATISFTAPVHDGGLPVTGYAVTSSPGGFTASGSSSPLTITGLSSSTSYTYAVTATNAIGTGPAITSGSVFATTIPQPVTIGTATATGAAGTVTVAFTANGTGGKTVTYTATSSPGGIVASSSGSPITVTGLTNGTAYTFTVVASNANGSAAASAASNAATPYTYVAPEPPPPSGVAPGVPRSLYVTANTSSTGGTYGFSAPATGTFPITVYYQFILQYAGPIVSSSVTFNNSSESANFSHPNNGYYELTAYAANSFGTSATVRAPSSGYTPFQYSPCITPGSMSGLVNASYNTSTQTITWSWSAPSPMGSNIYYQYRINNGPWYQQLNTSITSSSDYNTSNTIQVYAAEFCNDLTWRDGGVGTASIYTPSNPTIVPGSMSGLVSGVYNGSTLQSNFSWSAPTGTAPFTYYYNFGGTTFSTTGTTANTSGAATISVYASNSAGSGGSGSAATSVPTPNPSRWYCTTSVQCGGVGNCTQQAYDSNQTQSGSGYSIACSYNNTATYPPCQSTAGATCTGNLSCCSAGLKYICSEYDFSNQASVNWSVCYYTGQCAANSDPAGVRTRCCPPAC
jgi:large repetitive protein